MKMHQKEHREGTVGTFTLAGAKGHRGGATLPSLSAGAHTQIKRALRNNAPYT